MMTVMDDDGWRCHMLNMLMVWTLRMRLVLLMLLTLAMHIVDCDGRLTVIVHDVANGFM